MIIYSLSHSHYNKNKTGCCFILLLFLILLYDATASTCPLPVGITHDVHAGQFSCTKVFMANQQTGQHPLLP